MPFPKLCCLCCTNDHGRPDPSTTDPIPHPGKNMTVEALDNLILHLKDCMERMRSNSAVPENSSQVWEEYMSDIPGFLDALRKRQQQKATGTQIAKDTVLPVMKEVLGGIGSLHWVAFGCSMLAWGIDKLDKQSKNFEDCLDVLRAALFLVERTREMWAHEDESDRTEGGASSSSKHKHTMESILPQIAAVALTASAICVSCSPRKDVASRLTSYLGAHTVEASIIKLNDRIMMLGQQNLGIGQEQMMQMMKGIMAGSRAVSRYVSREGEGTIERKELVDKVETMLKVEDKETVVAAVCLHGIGGVGKSKLALTVFDKLLRAKKFVTCRLDMELESEQRDLPRFQEQILKDVRNNQMFSIRNATDGRERLLRAFEDCKDSCAPILLYIDNVEHPEFLPKLLPSLTHLPRGSRILITSRNAKASTFLDELGVKMGACICHPIEVKTLDGELSRDLLRKKALVNVEDKKILDNNPTLKDLEDQVLSLCGGLPLALNIIGSHIARRAIGGPESAETWMDVVNAMKDAKPVEGNEQDELYASLRVSINKLDPSLRFDLFVVVTCMLRDVLRDMDMVRSEFCFGRRELQDLIDRHLLEQVVEDGRRLRLGCHDVIASLVKRMAVWGGEHDELRIIQGIMWDQTSEDVDGEKAAGNIGSISWMQVTDAQLHRMKRLRYAFEIAVSCTISAFTKELQLEHLRVLQIREGKSEGRLKLGRFPRLRVLFVEDGNAVELEELVAPDLRELHYYNYCGRDQQSLSGCIHHFSVLQSLHLKVEWERLPEGISMLTTLRLLTLDGCQNLQHLPEQISTFKALMKLHLEGCESLQNIPQGIGQLTTLHDLCLRHCKRLQGLPEGISKLIALKVLDLNGCESLTDIPEGISELTSLSASFPEAISWPKACATRPFRLRLQSERNDGITTLSQEQAIGQQEIMERLEEDSSDGITTMSQEQTIGQQEIMEELQDVELMREYYSLEEGEDYPIGRRELLAEVEFLLKTEDDTQQKNVVAVCLHGMGGVGKSALAITIFQKLREQQEFVSCYVEMELESEQRDLPRFQEQILQEIKSQRIGRTSDGRIRIRNALHGRQMLLREFRESAGTPILLCIDNVENPEYLCELLPSLTYLPFGSGLLITSRNAMADSYLHRIHVFPGHMHSIEVKTLDENLSRALLRKEAFIDHILDSHPTLKDLEDQVLRLCDGLPLALKLVGSYIASGGANNPETWRHVVSAMKEARPLDGNVKDKLFASLRVSVDTLVEFLRSSLFDLVTYKLYERCDFVRLQSIFGADEMQTLIDRHLLEVVKEDRLKVRCHVIIASLVRRMVLDDIHDELRIIHGQQDVDEPGDVGSIESVDVTDVQLRQMRRLRYAFDVNVRITTGGSAVVDMPDLKVLEMSDVKSEGPLKLKLKLRGFANLRVLSVKEDGDVVDLEDLMAPNLGELQYYGGDWQRSNRCIHHFSHLRSLRLAVDWENLPPEGIGELASLTHLDLGGCKRLQALPEGISMLRSLSELHLRGCESLRCIPEGIRELTSLSHLDLSGCSGLQALPQGISSLRALRFLDLTGCESLRSIPQGISELTNLSLLDIHKSGNCSHHETILQPSRHSNPKVLTLL